MEANPKGPPYPEAFYIQVKQVLENFYDFPYLNKHPLAAAVGSEKVRPSETDGQRLRRVFLSAIDDVKPNDPSAVRSIQGRFYRLLELRYLESNTMQEVARELGVSERQAYRDLKRAEETLAAVLWARLESEIGGAYEDAAPKTLAGEQETGLEDIALQMRMVDANDLLQNVLRAVDRLALQKQVEITLNVPEESPRFFSDPRLAQQILISMASAVLQNAATRRLMITFTMEEDHASFRLEFDQEPGQAPLDPGSQVTSHLSALLGWKVSSRSMAGQARQEIRLTVEKREAVLLVIDDNQALIELLRRYLTTTRCQVIGISSGLEGLRAAQSVKPDAILLDVMMPEIDGWEILQRLKANPETHHIPVVVCSIFNDPGLAASLGAADILPKPVKREELLALLARLRLA